MEIQKKNIGFRLKEARKQLDLTLKEISENTDTSDSFISEIERGIKKPSVNYLYYLNSVYHININWILSGKGEMFVSLDAKDKNEKIDNLISFLESLKDGM